LLTAAICEVQQAARKLTLDLNFAALNFCSVQDVQTPLDEYVNREDPAYSYYEVTTYDDDPDFTVHVLNMTSQQWFDGLFPDNQ
jgi:hypothetical protein